MALRLLFLFQQAQYAQFSLLKSAPFCKLLAGLDSTNKSATSLLLLYDSPSVLATLSTPPSFLLFPISFLLFESLWKIWQELPSLSSCSIRLQWVLDTRFSWGTTRLISWPDGEHYPCLLQTLVVSLLLSLVSTLVFSRTGGALFNLNSLTHRFPRIPPRNLCSLVMLAVFSLVFLQRHSLLLSSYFSKIGRIENLCSACGHLSSHSALSSYGLFASLALWRLGLFTISGPGPGELLYFWGSMDFRHAPIPQKGSGNNSKNNTWLFLLLSYFRLNLVSQTLRSLHQWFVSILEWQIATARK